jgi:hypothetical protein
MPSPPKTKQPNSKFRSSSTFVKGTSAPAEAGKRSWDLADPAERGRRVVLLRSYDGDPSRSRGGKSGAKSTAIYLRNLSPAEQASKRFQIFVAEQIGLARARGEPDPQFYVRWEVQPIPHPIPGRTPMRNKSRDRRRAEAAERERAEAEARAKKPDS